MQHDLIRGCNPQPGACTTRQGERLQLFDSRLQGGTGSAGVVAARTDAGLAVRAGDGRHVLVQRVRPNGGGKLPAAEYAAAAGVAVGERFG